MVMLCNIMPEPGILPMYIQQNLVGRFVLFRWYHHQ